MFGGMVFTIVSASKFTFTEAFPHILCLLFFKQSIFISSVFFPAILQVLHFNKLENQNLQSSKKTGTPPTCLEQPFLAFSK